MSSNSKKYDLALLAIDLQPAFLSVMQDGDELARRCQFTLEVAKLFQLPVFITEQYPEKLGGTADEIQSVAPDTSRYYPKTTFSAFGADGLNTDLEELGVKHLLVIGLEVPVCVYNTVLEAGSRGVACTLLSDCIGARRNGDAAVCLDFLRTSTDCHILPSETVFYSLLRDAKDPLFREFTGLVKKYAAE